LELRNKGSHARRVLTAGGTIDLKRRYFWASDQSGTYPVDREAGIDQSNVSPGAREILCRMGMIQDLAQAKADADRIGNMPVSKERLRQIVEAEAAEVAEVAEVERAHHGGELRRRRGRRAGRQGSSRVEPDTRLLWS
jgi:hypothetical protein